jgi:hypothetical protein
MGKLKPRISDEVLPWNLILLADSPSTLLEALASKNPPRHLKTLRFALLALAAIALGSCADDDHEFTTYSGAQQKWPYAPGPLFRR